MPFKVTEVGTNRKPVCDFLLVIMLTDILPVPFQSYRRLVLKYWTFCVFEPPHGGLGATYTVHLRLFGKLAVDILFVLIELFALCVTAEALRANHRQRSRAALL